jgi:hypothetical protein
MKPHVRGEAEVDKLKVLPLWARSRREGPVVMNPVIKSAGKVFADDPEKVRLPLSSFHPFILPPSLTS